MFKQFSLWMNFESIFSLIFIMFCHCVFTLPYYLALRIISEYFCWLKKLTILFFHCIIDFLFIFNLEFSSNFVIPTELETIIFSLHFLVDYMALSLQIFQCLFITYVTIIDIKSWMEDDILQLHILGICILSKVTGRLIIMNCTFKCWWFCCIYSYYWLWCFKRSISFFIWLMSFELHYFLLSGDQSKNLSITSILIYLCWWDWLVIELGMMCYLVMSHVCICIWIWILSVIKCLHHWFKNLWIIL